MTRRLLLLSLLLLQLFAVQAVRSQSVNFDVLSIEAWIDDHKRMMTYLGSRTVQETAVLAQEKDMREKVKTYTDLSEKLDAYDRAFTILGALINGLSTAVRCAQSIQAIGERINDINTLKNQFIDQVGEDGLRQSDLAVIEMFSSAYSSLRTDVNALWQSITYLVAGSGYGGVGLRVSTMQMLDMLESVGASIDRIRKDITDLYLQFYGYVSTRNSSFFAREVWKMHSRQWICDGVLGRWQGSYNKSFGRSGGAASQE